MYQAAASGARDAAVPLGPVPSQAPEFKPAPLKRTFPGLSLAPALFPVQGPVSFHPAPVPPRKRETDELC